MMTLVTGGSKCGKSSFAERLLDEFEGEKYYIATMQPFGEEAFAAIARHQKMREGKGFSTIECYTDLAELILPEGCAVLLECVGNLCANEMFRSDVIRDPVPPVMEGIMHLRSRTSQIVVVTNEVGSDGITYTPETMEYIRNIAKINRQIATLSDTVIECVAGIPIVLKGEKPC